MFAYFLFTQQSTQLLYKFDFCVDYQSISQRRANSFIYRNIAASSICRLYFISNLRWGVDIRPSASPDIYIYNCNVVSPVSARSYFTHSCIHIYIHMHIDISNFQAALSAPATSVSCRFRWLHSEYVAIHRIHRDILTPPAAVAAANLLAMYF